MKIVAYSKRGCFYCDQLKKLIERAGLTDSCTFITVGSKGTVTKQEFAEKFPDASGYPLVLIDDEVIGGLVPVAKFLVENGYVQSRPKHLRDSTSKVMEN